MLCELVQNPVGTPLSAVFDRAKQTLLDRAKLPSSNRLPSRSRGGPVEQRRLNCVEANVCRSDFGAIAAADECEVCPRVVVLSDDDARAGRDGVFLVRPSSQPARYATSLKNQDHEIVHVVVGTSFAEQRRRACEEENRLLDQ